MEIRRSSGWRDRPRGSAAVPPPLKLWPGTGQPPGRLRQRRRRGRRPPSQARREGQQLQIAPERLTIRPVVSSEPLALAGTMSSTLRCGLQACGARQACVQESPTAAATISRALIMRASSPMLLLDCALPTRLHVDARLLGWSGRHRIDQVFEVRCRAHASRNARTATHGDLIALAAAEPGRMSPACSDFLRRSHSAAELAVAGDSKFHAPGLARALRRRSASSSSRRPGAGPRSSRRGARSDCGAFE